MFYTYVLNCKSGAKSIFYIGSTGDLQNRLDEHKNGKVKTTHKFDKIDLLYYEACHDKIDATKRELQLKTGFGRGYLKKRISKNLS